MKGPLTVDIGVPLVMPNMVPNKESMSIKLLTLADMFIQSNLQAP